MHVCIYIHPSCIHTRAHTHTQTHTHTHTHTHTQVARALEVERARVRVLALEPGSIKATVLINPATPPDTSRDTSRDISQDTPTDPHAEAAPDSGIPIFPTKLTEYERSAVSKLDQIFFY